MTAFLNSFLDRIRANPVRWAVISLLTGMLLGGMCGGWACGRGGEEPAPVVEEKIVTQEVIQEVEVTREVPVTVEVSVVEEVPVTAEVTREVPVTVTVPQVVEVPVPVTIQIPVTVQMPATAVPTPTPTPEPVATPEVSDGAGEVKITLTPASGPPGTRVQMQWSDTPPLHQGAAYFDGDYLSDYKRCSLGLCGPPHVGVISIPNIRDATPGPYLVGVGDGQQLYTAVWMMTR